MGFFIEQKYAEVQIFIFLDCRSSASFQKSYIFKNGWLSDGSTRSKTQKNVILDFYVFFLDNESLEVTVFFYRKLIGAKLRAWKIVD